MSMEPSGAVDLATHRFGFDGAILHLKAGNRVARAGWNGKGMWIALTPGSVILLSLARSGAAVKLAEDLRDAGDVGSMAIAPHIDMKAADGTLVIGWLASQTDMLADDWMVVP